MAVGLNTNKAWLQVRDYLGASGGVYDFYLNPTGGRLIVNSETSDGVGALQINGTLSFRNNISVIPAIRFVPKPSLITSTSQGDLETGPSGLLYYSYNTNDRGVVENSHYLILSSSYTLTSSTTSQRIFNTNTNGGLGVQALLYEFEMDLYITGFSTGSNGSLNISFNTGGGATLTSIRYTAVASKGTVTTAGTAQITTAVSAANTAITSSNTSSAATAKIRGVMRFSSAGWIAPRITLSVASSAVVQPNSIFKLTPLGDDANTSMGETF